MSKPWSRSGHGSVDKYFPQGIVCQALCEMSKPIVPFLVDASKSNPKRNQIPKALGFQRTTQSQPFREQCLTSNRRIDTPGAGRTSPNSRTLLGGSKLPEQEVDLAELWLWLRAPSRFQCYEVVWIVEGKYAGEHDITCVPRSIAKPLPM